ncbi:MAG TPA: dTDP-4-dehydrorhamnose 3,5-epimerase [Thermoanaerobaculia bacterium]|nr:dTDP-4-dehydrorhamnose 3,5-epimerase [Thermoanaerobaculia bacterium]
MKFLPTAIPGVTLVEPAVFRDERGFFLETYHQGKFRDGGLPEHFLQDNHSFSIRGTLRGLHAQLRKPQGKLVRAIEGEIFDVAVDIRPDSPTFGQWVGEVLSGENLRQLYVPPGFAHGFCVLSETAHVGYKCTELYDREDEIIVLWSDPALAIAWPVEEPRLSPKDAAAPKLAEILHLLPGHGKNHL